jgi:phosphoribosylformimino-5-aminoimidazole carboxamide ribotide isomerase
LIVIPAIDIKGKKCVRLEQGRMDAETIYSENPVEVARNWQAAGAELIHLVDLDAAITGETLNFEAISEIANSIDVPVQIGGGIRDIASAEKYLAIKNVKRVIIGTAAFENKEFVIELAKKYPGRVAVGIDAKDGLVAIKGWVEVTETSAMELAKSLQGFGVAAIIYTDIARDGMLTGPNVEATKALAEAIDIPVIASGGISKLSDIEALMSSGVEGAITGKAIYSGSLDLTEAIKRTKS